MPEPPKRRIPPKPLNVKIKGPLHIQPTHILEAELRKLSSMHEGEGGSLLTPKQDSRRLAIQNILQRRHAEANPQGFNPEYFPEQQPRQRRGFLEDPREKAIRRNKRKKR